MNNLQMLLESSNPYTSQQKQSEKLAEKWVKSGLLEGLEGTHRNNMALMLENQAKQLVVESSQTGGGTSSTAGFTAGTGDQWMGVALPLVRKIFGQISTKEFMSVQPMNLPSGLAFFLDFQYGNTKGGQTAGTSVYGTADTSSPFGNTNAGALYGAGRFTYSTNNTSSTATVTTGSATWADLNFDSVYSASAAAGGYKTASVPTSSLPNLDLAGVRAFSLPANGQLNQFTKISGGNLIFIVSGSDTDVSAQAASKVITYQLQPTDKYRGDFEDGNTALNSNNSTITIPEINVQMKSTPITAKTKKLKAVWTPEFAQDINAYHSLDAEAEITSILSEYISLEIDLENLDMLINGAVGTEYWSAINNQAINAAGTAFDVNLGFYNSQGQWFQTLGTKMTKVSNDIHQKTMRGGANFAVVSPKVATILESIPGFGADANGDVTKATYAFGAQKIGSINGTYKIYKNPYMVENTILMGYKGSQFLETGAVFAPYIPLIITPLVYDPDTFTPRKGLLTRFAKKMLRGEFYSKIVVSGLTSL